MRVGVYTFTCCACHLSQIPQTRQHIVSHRTAISTSPSRHASPCLTSRRIASHRIASCAISLPYNIASDNTMPQDTIPYGRREVFCRRHVLLTPCIPVSLLTPRIPVSMLSLSSMTAGLMSLRPVRLLRVWISEGLTQADSQF